MRSTFTTTVSYAFGFISANQGNTLKPKCQILFLKYFESYLISSDQKEGHADKI